jgi:hypothetical protein
MITCVVDYVIDPSKAGAFEEFAKRWMELVNRHGGTHHGFSPRKDPATERLRCSASQAQPSTSNTDLYSVTIRTSLPQTGSGMRVAAC